MAFHISTFTFWLYFPTGQTNILYYVLKLTCCII